jgi:methylmalonyl-CoA/ethylmalonyl-CoA epimerase
METAVPEKIQKIDHVGIAVPDLEAAIRLYTLLFGTGPASIEEVPEQKVRTAFFQAGEATVELLCPTAPDSPIAGFLAKRGGGIHHLCLTVPDLEHALAALAAQGVELIDKTPRLGAHGKRIAFVHPKSLGGVLLELSEAPRPGCVPAQRLPHAGPRG